MAELEKEATSKTGASESEAPVGRPRELVSCVPHPWRVRDRELALGQGEALQGADHPRGPRDPPPLVQRGEGAAGRRVSGGGAGAGPLRNR